jgi:hypothetical protein
MSALPRRPEWFLRQLREPGESSRDRRDGADTGELHLRVVGRDAGSRARWSTAREGHEAEHVEESVVEPPMEMR